MSRASSAGSMNGRPVETCKKDAKMGIGRAVIHKQADSQTDRDSQNADGQNGLPKRESKRESE